MFSPYVVLAGPPKSAEIEVASPSPASVRCRPGFSMKFSPTVAEIADISPICSIMVARAIGAMTKIAVISNLHHIKGGSPTQEAAATLVKFKIADPSGFVIPQAFMIRAAVYEMTTPSRIGIIRNMPFPQILNTIMTDSAISARIQLVEAFATADGARPSPMQMIIGPVTTGGR